MKSGYYCRRNLLILLLSLVGFASFAGAGDTTTIQAFTFGSPLEGKFLFPDSTHRWSKILMYYTLKCNPNQSPACGEWDYLTYTYLYRHTGKFDSTQYTHPNFTFNGITPDSLMLMHSPSYTYYPYFEYFCQTPPTLTAKVGIGTEDINTVFYSPRKDSRAQCLWRKNELLYAGLMLGQITGLRFHVKSAGSKLKKLTIRMKSTDLDSLPADVFQEGEFTEVFKRDFRFADTGWQVIPFTYPFEWNANSGIIVDISFEDHESNIQSLVSADPTGFPSVAISDSVDYFLSFRDMDYVKVPASAFASVDSSITVAFWIYGDSLFQPQNNTVFEGVNSKGNRIVNNHLPWGDGTVYWDAGGDSLGYDRLYKYIDDPALYRGKWSHWAFVKNAKTRKMKIYCNGSMIRISSGPLRRMNGITEFRIGSNAMGNDVFYDGFIDEFSVWNKELPDTAIRKIMYQDITPDNPDYQNLVAYFRFNEGNGFSASDNGLGEHTGELGGFPEWQGYKGVGRFRNVSSSSLRPAIVFEHGIYDPSKLDSLFRVDTLVKSPVMAVMYGDSAKPWLPTDTLSGWPAFYNNYIYSSSGVAIDSTLVPPDEVIHRKDYIYYGDPYEVLDRYELARYITPYGNSLSLGDGWTWVYDLTDYAPFLHDSVHLSSGNWQELLDMKFKMIEGIPPRDVLGITNIYTGGHGYANESQHNLPPVKVKIGSNISNARLKMRITGHGFGGNLDCSEFCPRTNLLFINGNQAYTHYVWRKCGINPLYPQGGTWLYDRAAWCPGAEVSTTDFELTPYLVPGDTMTIDYDLQAGYTWNGQGSWPYYQIESQLITYGQPNFGVDVSMEEIIAPNDHELYNRFNPVCGKPVISIKNNGKTNLTSCEIQYGPIGGKLQLFQWRGDLAFQDTAVITLPPIDWTDWTGGDNRFSFKVDKPNKSTDEYPSNNEMTSHFEIPPVYDNILQFEFRSNHEAASLSWIVEDENENVIYQRNAFEKNTNYLDTFRLSKGCYRLTIRNAEGEGLRYWANMPPYGNGTAGYARIKTMDETLVKNFQADFGSVISQSFSVGFAITLPEVKDQGFFSVYPNPSDGKFTVSAVLEHNEDLMIIIMDGLGKEIKRDQIKGAGFTDIPVDLTDKDPGVYTISLITPEKVALRKVLVY
jgi:hypothetical protein